MAFFEWCMAHPGLVVSVILMIATFIIGVQLPSPAARLQARRLQQEIDNYKRVLSTRAEIEAESLLRLKTELEEMRRINENLRVTNKTLMGKPSQAELRLLHVYDRAINSMLASNPVFGPTWQRHLDEALQEMKHVEQGMLDWVKRVFRPSEQSPLSEQSQRLLAIESKSAEKGAVPTAEAEDQ